MYVFCTDLEDTIVLIWQNNLRFATCTKHVTQKKIIGRQILVKMNTSHICLVFLKAVRNRIEIICRNCRRVLTPQYKNGATLTFWVLLFSRSCLPSF